MLKLKHIRHPIRTFGTAQSLFAARWNMKVLAPRGEQRFRNDPRYDLKNVTSGFASQLDDSDDREILNRICTAYIRTMELESSAPKAYRPTEWWENVRQASLAPVRKALASRDISALSAMYRNFFRDPCSGGLVGVPYQMAKAYAGQPVQEPYQRFFLSDALHRIDYWKTQTGNRFELRELVGPRTGNPFGVLLDGVFVRTGAEFQHYCAFKINSLLDPGRASVVEIGGGFGGMAYYLLRDRPETVYCDFDVPESIALTTYYLLKSFSHFKFLLFKEEELSEDSLRKFDVVLLPAFELAKLAPKTIDLTFSSHTMSGLDHDARIEYLDQLTRSTRMNFFYVGREAESASFKKLLRRKYPSLTIAERHRLDWNIQKYLNAGEVECIYRIAGELA